MPTTRRPTPEGRPDRRRGPAFTIVVALAMALASGCLGPDGGDGDGAKGGTGGGPLADASSLDIGRIYEFDHDHTDPVAHDTAWNLERVAVHSLTDDGVPLGVPGEIDVAGDVAAIHLQGDRTGFAVVDVSDPTLPRLLSVVDASAYRPFEARDVKLDPDGSYAYLALQLSSPDPPGGGPAQGGFLVYSLADPSAPLLVGQAAETGRGCHMIRYWEHAGERVVYCASTQGLSFWTLEDTPSGSRTPVKAGTWVPPDPERASERAAASIDPTNPLATLIGTVTVLQPHDMTAQLDPVTDTPILVAAYEVYGVITLDITDPTAPTPISVWNGEGADHFDRVHTAAVAMIGERRVAVAVTEVYGDTVAAMFLVDVTDWSVPALLSEWTPGDDSPSHNGLFSTHNMQIVGDTVYMAHFHAGVWTFDVSDPTTPQVTGVYQVVQPTITPGGSPIGGAPAYWDVVVRDGYVLGSDTSAGLVVLAHADDPVGEPTWDSWV